MKIFRYKNIKGNFMSKVKVRFDGKIYDNGLAKTNIVITPELFTKLKILKFVYGKEFDGYLIKALERFMKEEDELGRFDSFDFSELIWEQKSNHLSEKFDTDLDLNK